MTEKKYELVKYRPFEYEGHTLYRVRALRDFANVKAGDIGGYIESERNLIQVGNGWVGDNASISGDIHISGKYRITGSIDIEDEDDA